MGMENKARTTIIIALITVGGTVAVAVISNWDKIGPSQTGQGQGPVPQPAPQPVPQPVPQPAPQPVPQPVPQPDPTPSFSEWPLEGGKIETFTRPSKWNTGNRPTEYVPRNDLRIVGGRYRWDLEFARRRVTWQRSPHGAALDFYIAVDLEMTEVDTSSANGGFTVLKLPVSVEAGLIFGKTSEKYYRFVIRSNNQIRLQRMVDSNWDDLVEWHAVDADPTKEATRLAVLVDDQIIKLYVNTHLVDRLADTTFTGGTVGLTVAVMHKEAAVLDFDNFEFRRKP